MITFSVTIQQSLKNTNDVPLHDHPSIVRDFLLKAITTQKNLKEKEIEPIIKQLMSEAMRASVSMPENTTNIQSDVIDIDILKFMREIIFPLLSTSLNLNTVLTLQCLSCSAKIRRCISRNFILMQQSNVQDTVHLMEQVLLSSNSNATCTNCNKHDGMWHIDQVVINCPNLLFIFRTQTPSFDDASFVQKLNFQSYFDRTIIALQYYGIYQLVGCVTSPPHKEKTTFSPIAYCRNQKYYMINNKKKTVIEKRNLARLLQSSVVYMYQKITVQGADFVNALLSLLGGFDYLRSAQIHHHYSLHDGIDALKKMYPDVATEMSTTVRYSLLFFSGKKSFKKDIHFFSTRSLLIYKIV
jgi:hypothetical protein